MLFDRILTRLIKTGDLTVTDWNGREFHYGDGTTPKVHVKFASAAAARKIAFDPDLYLGEAYTSGDFSIVKGRLYDFMELALQNTNADGLIATDQRSLISLSSAASERTRSTIERRTLMSWMRTNALFSSSPSRVLRNSTM